MSRCVGSSSNSTKSEVSYLEVISSSYCSHFNMRQAHKLEVNFFNKPSSL